MFFAVTQGIPLDDHKHPIVPLFLGVSPLLAHNEQPLPSMEPTIPAPQCAANDLMKGQYQMQAHTAALLLAEKQGPNPTVLLGYGIQHASSSHSQGRPLGSGPNTCQLGIPLPWPSTLGPAAQAKPKSDHQRGRPPKPLFPCFEEKLPYLSGPATAINAPCSAPAAPYALPSTGLVKLPRHSCQPSNPAIPQPLCSTVLVDGPPMAEAAAMAPDRFSSLPLGTCKVAASASHGDPGQHLEPGSAAAIAADSGLPRATQARASTGQIVEPAARPLQADGFPASATAGQAPATIKTAAAAAAYGCTAACVPQAALPQHLAALPVLFAESEVAMDVTLLPSMESFADLQLLVVGKLGAGGNSTVWHVRWPGAVPLSHVSSSSSSSSRLEQLPSDMALKVGMRLADAPNSCRRRYNAAQYFQVMKANLDHEAELLAACSKVPDYAVQCYAKGKAVAVTGEELPCLLLELSPHGSVDRLLEPRGRVPCLPPDVVRCILQYTVFGLYLMQMENVVYRDLKASNLLMYGPPEAPWTKVKFSDFGSGWLIRNQAELPEDWCVGTRVMRAPEMQAGCRHDCRVDNYMFGLMFLELRYGFCPFWYLLPSDKGPFSIGISMEEREVRFSNPIYELQRLDCPYNISGLWDGWVPLYPMELEFLGMCLQPNPAYRATAWGLVDSRYGTSYNPLPLTEGLLPAA